LAHAPADVRASRGFTPEAGRLGGRPRNPRVVEVIKERIESDLEIVLSPLREALTATTPTGHPDHPVRLRAAAELLDRAYGRPRQATEISGADGSPLVVTLAELAARYATETDDGGDQDD
jgi:LmbE family N-acetylglucosaminyl deacetylase